MKKISDIRVYRSEVENIDEVSSPSEFTNRKLDVAVHRIVMKLRELEFSLGEFTHLYVNLTTCVPEGLMQLARRSPDTYHPWYRYYDVGVSEDLYEELGEEDSIATITSLIEQLLLLFFAGSEQKEVLIKTAITEACTKGEKMRIKFKEKKSTNSRAVIYLQYLEDACYQPTLCVYDLEGNELLQERLERCVDFDALGQIQLSSKKVTIKPRTSVYAARRKPITFLLEEINDEQKRNLDK